MFRIFIGSESNECGCVCVCVTDRRSQRDRQLKDERVQRDADGAAEAWALMFLLWPFMPCLATWV